MATDYAAIVAKLEAFYDFTGKAVLHVGAGTGLFIDYAKRAGSVLAVDSDSAALEQLRVKLQQKGLEERVTIRNIPFEIVEWSGDVVLIEFCLHEIPDPEAALARARGMAPDVVVFDHAAGSDWCRYTLEAEKVAGSWAAVRRASPVREQAFQAVQAFDTYADLAAKLKPLGEPGFQAIESFVGRRGIEIDMPYAAALLTGKALQ